MENLLTVIVTLLVGSPLMAVLTHFLNRRARHAEARLKNAEADKAELSKKRDEVGYYRDTIENLVSDMEALRIAQDKTDQRYQDQTNSLHSKIDGLKSDLDTANLALVQANKTISELEREVKRGGEKTSAFAKELNRANESLDAANLEIKGLREVITGLQEKVTALLVERAEKK